MFLLFYKKRSEKTKLGGKNIFQLAINIFQGYFTYSIKLLRF